MNLAVIGSGGREHAICYKLKQSPKIKKLICVPGNAGTFEGCPGTCSKHLKAH